MRVNHMVVGLAATVLAAASTVAEPPARQGRHAGRGPMEGAAFYLGLTDEQKAQLAEHREKARPQTEALVSKMRDNRERMQQALEAQAPDPATVGAIAIEGHRLHGLMKAQREAAEKELRAMLTPEQQTKLDALQALRRAGAGGRGRGGPMRHEGPMPFGPDGADDEPPPPPQE